MERFVFVAAIVVAVFFALGAMFGGGSFVHGWRFEISGDDHGPPAALVTLSPGAMPAQTFAGDTIRIRHAAARVQVIPEERTDVSIEIDNNAGAAPLPEVETREGDIIIDGRLRGRIGGCDGETVTLRGYANITREQMPLITIRAPREVNLHLGGATYAEIGATRSLAITHTGCGVTRAADVTGQADVNLAGPGAVFVGAAQRAELNMAGSGRISLGAIADGVDIDMAGSGVIEIASLQGNFERDGAGSGDVFVRAGAIRTADISQAGSGDVELTAAVETLDAAIMGSGSVLVTGDVAAIDARIMGSGSVIVRGTVGSIDANVMGSGQVRATAVTGTTTQRVRGSGQVVIGP